MCWAVTFYAVEEGDVTPIYIESSLLKKNTWICIACSILSPEPYKIFFFQILLAGVVSNGSNIEIWHIFKHN